ncbi:IQ calmodulin-binding motif-containing protein 1-like [Oscarella lobularis]|uniref:IQ calmodulin-binding motif-containing protein 1-like n=1 Tax=Oscarella lobularis TaxID=121494 RepID=UPI0033139835
MNPESGVKQRIQSLAVEVSESGDENLAWKLLTVVDVLGDCRRSSNRLLLTAAHEEIWRYGLLETIVEILKDDFDDVRGEWNTAAKLAQIVAECIENVRPIHAELDFASNAVETLLLVASAQQEKFVAILNSGVPKGDAKPTLDDFRATLDGATRLGTNVASLSTSFLQSPLLLHMLITENPETAHLVLTAIRRVVQSNAKALRKIDEIIISNLLDEIVFKVSSTREPFVACSAVRLSLALADARPDRFLPLFVAQYGGLRPLIAKWKRQGFDDDVHRLLALLDSNQEERFVERRRDDAARRIQALWKGREARRRVDAGRRGVVKLQRLVRDWLGRKREGKRSARLDLLTRQAKEDQYRVEIRRTMVKQMAYLEHVPAGKVDAYLTEREAKAATVLQSRYRGLLARRKLAKRRAFEERDKAARRIQREYRGFVERRRLREREAATSLDLNRWGFDIGEERRREIEERIAIVRERSPYRFETIESLRELHDRAQRMVGDFLSSRRRDRDGDVRRRALVARLRSDAAQFLSAPRLVEAGVEDVEAFSSASGPVVAMAQRAHAEELKAARLPWWKRVPLGENIDLAELGAINAT